MLRKSLILYVSLAVFLCIGGLSASEKNGFNFSRDEYFEIKDLSLEITGSHCPVEECMVVILGRSPTPIGAFLEALGIKKTFFLPLSSFRYGEGKYRQLKLNEKEQLFNHFDHYLPSFEEIESQGGTLLVIDFIVNGHSLVSAVKHIREYYQRRYQKTPKIKKLALEGQSKKRKTGREKDYFRVNFKTKGPQAEVIDLCVENYPILDKYFESEVYDPFGKYASFYIGKLGFQNKERECNNLTISKLPKNEKYCEFLNELGQLVLSDKKSNSKFWRKNQRRSKSFWGKMFGSSPSEKYPIVLLQNGIRVREFKGQFLREPDKIGSLKKGDKVKLLESIALRYGFDPLKLWIFMGAFD